MLPLPVISQRKIRKSVLRACHTTSDERWWKGGWFYGSKLPRRRREFPGRSTRRQQHMAGFGSFWNRSKMTRQTNHPRSWGCFRSSEKKILKLKLHIALFHMQYLVKGWTYSLDGQVSLAEIRVAWYAVSSSSRHSSNTDGPFGPGTPDCARVSATGHCSRFRCGSDATVSVGIRLARSTRII